METVGTDVKQPITKPTLSPSRLLDELQFDGGQTAEQSPSIENGNQEESDDEMDYEAMLVSKLNQKEEMSVKEKVIVEENNAEIAQVYLCLCANCSHCCL